MKYTIYHSREWDCLVEQGWVTVSVDSDGLAKMVWNPKK